MPQQLPCAAAQFARLYNACRLLHASQIDCRRGTRASASCGSYASSAGFRHHSSSARSSSARIRPRIHTSSSTGTYRRSLAAAAAAAAA